MTIKLTLSLDDKVITRAKRIAKRRGKSLSKMVEEYFNSISQNEKNKVSIVANIEKRMTSYFGESTFPEETDFKKLVKDWKYKDYLNQKG